MGSHSKRWGVLAICLTALMFIGGHLAVGQEGRRDDGFAHQMNSSRSPKISPILARTLDRMASMGVTRDTMGAFDLRQFSTRLVRVDQDGRVQVELYVHQLDDMALNELRSAGVTVEATNFQHRIVQGWVPFDLVERVAELANVHRSRPPAYAVPGSRTTDPPRSK